MKCAIPVFNLDGAFVDSVPDLRAALNQMLGEMGRRELTLFVLQRSAIVTPIVECARACQRQLNPEMICGYEALDLEKRKPSVVIARFPDSACGDDLDITWAAGGLARSILGCDRHSRGHAVTCGRHGAVGDRADRRERTGRIDRGNRIDLLRRKPLRIRADDASSRVDIVCASLGKGRV